MEVDEEMLESVAETDEVADVAVESVTEVWAF